MKKTVMINTSQKRELLKEQIDQHFRIHVQKPHTTTMHTTSNERNQLHHAYYMKENRMRS